MIPTNVGERITGSDEVCNEAHGRTFFCSAQADALTVKGYTYGMDVHVHIGLTIAFNMHIMVNEY